MEIKMTQDKKIKVEFAPGCFDSFDGTQQELDNIVAHIREMAESGQLEELSQPLTDDVLDELSEEEQQFLLEQLEDGTHERKSTLN